MLYHVKISIFNNISNNVIFANYAKSANYIQLVRVL